MLDKNYLITFNEDIVIYYENNNYIFITISNVRKYNENIQNYYFHYITENEFNYYGSIFYFNYKINKLKFNNKFKLFKEIFYNNKAKLKIIGRGWKIIKYSYELLIKLGYSHMMFLYLSPLIKNKLKKKKKKYYIFYGVLNNELSTLLNKIKLMRIPDNYTRKGIFYKKSIL